MWVLYLLVKNFGVAVILFTLVVKLASFPLNIKQQKNMAISQLYAPRVQEIQRKYRNNNQKMQEEMSKLQKEGYNPMGGCGPMIVIMVILFGVIDVVYKPMTHLERLDWVEKGSIEIVKELGAEAEYASVVLGSEQDKQLILEFIKDDSTINITAALPQYVSTETDKRGNEIDTKLVYAKHVTNDERENIGGFVADNLDALISKNSRLSFQVKDALKSISTSYRKGSLYGELAAVQMYGTSPDAFRDERLKPEIYTKLDTLTERIIFLGLNLGQRPSLKFEPLIIIPIISFIFSALQMYITSVIQKKTMPDVQQNAQAMSSMKMMYVIAPVFSLWISFTVPAGAGFYWAVSYMFGIAQSIATYKFWPPEKIRAEALAKQKARADFVVKYTPQQTKALETSETTGETSDEQPMAEEKKFSELSKRQKDEVLKKRLEEARKRMDEKYGD
ncbi:MAG: membrane protein insertase YidC [Oscillospiraceae bacterium]|jgi:YidC/Oxa1 family membrane protein insertase|nr:membrane protein insertase YidC [Oscillospiraceae bacterium]